MKKLRRLRLKLAWFFWRFTRAGLKHRHQQQLARLENKWWQRLRSKHEFWQQGPTAGDAMNILVSDDGAVKKVNPSNGRAVKFVPFGLACYEGKLSRGHYEGSHVGIVEDEAAADLFLEGGSPRMVKVDDRAARTD